MRFPGCRFAFAIFILVTFSIVPANGQDQKLPADRLLTDVVYTSNDTLKADFHFPQNYKQQKNPVIIFVSAGDFRKIDHYVNWAAFFVADGFIGITYNSNRDHAAKNLDELVNFISKNSAKYFIDDQQVSICAGSGMVPIGLPFANENSSIKAALFFYGFADIQHFRVDLPVLLVRSGLDNNSLNKRLDTLAFRALEANAAYTVFNFNSAVHGFEGGEDLVTKFVLQSAVDFLKTNLKKPVQDRFSQKQNEIVAVREMYHGNWNAALTAFQEALKNNPGDNETERQMANVYIELKDYEHAIDAYNGSLAHGNWRKGEIAVKKCLAYAALNNSEAAVAEMRILKRIGWFDESSYAGNNIFKNVVGSQAYKKFITEK